MKEDNKTFPDKPKLRKYFARSPALQRSKSSPSERNEKYITR